ARIRKMSTTGKIAAMLTTWILLCLIIIAPLNFPVSGFVTFDRYLYFVLPFIFSPILLLLSKISRVFIAPVIILYLTVSIFCLIKMNNYWYHSAKIVSNLIKKFPAANDNRTILLLDVPENLNGVVMIGSKPMAYYDPHSAFKMMYTYERGVTIK